MSTPSQMGILSEMNVSPGRSKVTLCILPVGHPNQRNKLHQDIGFIRLYDNRFQGLCAWIDLLLQGYSLCFKLLLQCCDLLLDCFHRIPCPGDILAFHQLPG